ncbi:MAG: DNA integrity scanning protein DisA nucleotide-binding domain protein [Erysipelotrichales bacterium]|nr:DNA integrity scanning protein DisA nucleotide-binding domain protein [Erysipelotrichales bacterium]
MFLTDLNGVLGTLKSPDFIAGASILVIFAVFIALIFKRRVVLAVDITMTILLIAALAFGYNVVFSVLSFAYMTFIAVVAIINAGIFRHYIANPTDKIKGSSKLFVNNNLVENKVTDQATMIKEISEAVTNLSKTKTGALITFERKDSLDEYIKTGTVINSPITKELIQTIFYPGTRLHDGAIVIRDNIIVSASVYYTPTTKPLSGKYGARHRAAMGISETTDSVTIIVSEETGRISIAADGNLVPIALDNFERSLNDYLEVQDL